MVETPSRRDDNRSRIVEAAARLLSESGPAAVTTRAVAEGARVQAPAIYRLFGDKDGLLEAVAEHVMATYVAAKAAHVREASATAVDPVEDLRAGWQMQIDFGVANPSVFQLLNDPGRGATSPAAQSGIRVLAQRMRRIAETGRLRVSEQRAINIIHSAGVGTVQTLLAAPVEQRDPGLAEDMFQAVLQQILTDAPAPAQDGVLPALIAFRALAPRLDMLSDAERQLLGEWLDRAVASSS